MGMHEMWDAKDGPTTDSDSRPKTKMKSEYSIEEGIEAARTMILEKIVAQQNEFFQEYIDRLMADTTFDIKPGPGKLEFTIDIKPPKYDRVWEFGYWHEDDLAGRLISAGYEAKEVDSRDGVAGYGAPCVFVDDPIETEPIEPPVCQWGKS